MIRQGTRRFLFLAAWLWLSCLPGAFARPALASLPSPEWSNPADYAPTTSPLKNRVKGSEEWSSGRFSPGDDQTLEIATGSNGCDYESASGRRKWLNRDPIGELGGINLYSYAFNNPINRIDPLGLKYAESWAKVGFVGGMGAATLGSVAVDVATGGLNIAATPVEIAWGGAVGGAIGYGLGSALDWAFGTKASPSFMGKPTHRPGTKPIDCPTGTIPINQHPGTKGDVHGIKRQLEPEGVGPKSWIGVDREGNIIVTNPDGTHENLGPFDSYQ